MYDKQLGTHINVFADEGNGVIRAWLAAPLVLKAALLAADGWDRLCQTKLSRGIPSFVEYQPVDVVDEVGERDLGLGTRDADGTDEQRHLVLLPREHMPMRARMVDLAALARAVRAGIGLPFGSLRRTRLALPIDLSHASLEVVGLWRSSAFSAHRCPSAQPWWGSPAKSRRRSCQP